jgi:acyl dehydratase
LLALEIELTGLDDFSPSEHKMLPERSFDDFEIGEKFFAPSRTMTEGIFTNFQAASSDNHPIHYDRNYLAELGHPDLMAHGFMTLIQAAIGATPLAHSLGKNLIGFVDQSSKFLKPVYCGDTVYPIFEISELSPNKSTGIMGLSIKIYNQNKGLVLQGMQRYLIKM